MGAVQGVLPREGFHLHYRIYGAGKPVAILAGGPGMDCEYVEPVALEVAKTHQAILVELRGTGRSVPPVVDERTINLTQYLVDLEELRAHLKLDRWSLLGHSAGAVLAMNYAGAHAARVDTMILVNAGPICFAHVAPMMDNVLLRLSPEERIAVSNPAGPDLKAMLIGFFYDREKALAQAAIFAPERYHPAVAKLLAASEMFPGMDLRPSLRNFDRPTLVIAGRQDPFDPAAQYAIHLTLQKSEIVLLHRCGHYAWLEQPEEFYKAVDDFLAR